MENMKSAFIGRYDIFKNGMSGFTWNPTKVTWDAEHEVWQHLIEGRTILRISNPGLYICLLMSLLFVIL
ncbi:hypothetical protein DsansV1_C06g0064471 [Dioscorea sansibarensis]